MYWALYAPLLAFPSASSLHRRGARRWRAAGPARVALAPRSRCPRSSPGPTSSTARRWVSSARARAGGPRPLLDVLPRQPALRSGCWDGAPEPGRRALPGFHGRRGWRWSARRRPSPRIRWDGASRSTLCLAACCSVWAHGARTARLAPGPYGCPFEFVPGFRNVRYPERFAHLRGAGPRAAGGRGPGATASRRAGLGSPARGAAAVRRAPVDPAAAGAAAGDREIPQVYHWLAGQDEVRVVAEVPSARYGWSGSTRCRCTSRRCTGSAPRRASRLLPADLQLHALAAVPFPGARERSFLERFGVDTVVVHPDPGGPPAWGEAARGGRRPRPSPRARRPAPARGPRPAYRGRPSRRCARWTAVVESAGVLSRRPERALDGDPRRPGGPASTAGRGDFLRVTFARPQTHRARLDRRRERRSSRCR